MRFFALLALAGALSCTLLLAPGAIDTAHSEEYATIEDALRAQLPRELPAEGSPGWPQPAITLAITWFRIGEHELALDMAEQIWLSRDQHTGLWLNGAGYIDGINPFFATLLFTILDQPERAWAISHNVIRHARTISTSGAYNEIWFAALSARLLGDPVPQDLHDRAAPGLHGRYAPAHDKTSRGRYYSDLMRAYDCATGGVCRRLISDETDHCPYLGTGRRECESFYAWANGAPIFPDLAGEAYNFWTDGILFYALPGLGLGFDPESRPQSIVAPLIAGGALPATGDEDTP